MSTRNKRHSSGFTIVELVVVIVIIGILAATALPRFVDLTGEAHSASVQGVGGAYASAVNLVHSAWMANGGNSAVNSVTLEGSTTIGVNDTGWPENTDSGGGNDTITAAECGALWTGLLLNPPSSATDTASEYQHTASSQTCTYTLQAASSRTIAYDSASGAVTISVP